MMTVLPSHLSKPSQRAFDQAGIKSMDDLKMYSEKDLLALHGVGPKTIRQLKEAGGSFKNT